jgi:Uncharacterized conserved domain (SAYSvFN)
MTTIDGFYRSRVLWDRVRRHNNNHRFYHRPLNTTTTKRSWLNYEYYQAMYQAILYEIQPIRYENLLSMIQSCRLILDDSYSYVRKHVQNVDLSNVVRSSLFRIKNDYYPTIQSLVCSKLPIFLQHYWKYIIVAICYYIVLRFIHETIHAGPIVIIITLLVIIFTIGLNDDTHDANYISAYSVFNQGFQKLMGTIDTDTLLAQYMGGGFGAAAAGGMMMMNHGDHPHDNDIVMEQEPIPPLHPQRRQQQVDLVMDHHEPADDNDDDANEMVQPNHHHNNNNNNNNTNNNRSRLSNKKGRRKMKNIEQRRDIQRQREAAAHFRMEDDWEENDNDHHDDPNILIRPNANHNDDAIE